MEQENQPEKIQFVIVPEFILTDSNIPIGEKLLFGDIASHTKQKDYCWGSNEYFFGVAEISQMFESATPELLHKIAGVIAEHGCKDVKECMQKSPWYREFELSPLKKSLSLLFYPYLVLLYSKTIEKEH